MRIGVSTSVAQTYTSPGQYVELRIDGQTGFFVLAGEPGEPDWHLVMRSGGGASDVLLRTETGVALETSVALGAGFPLRDARGLPLTVALAGTGVAAGRPVIRRRIGEGDAARTRVWLGIRTRDELPMRSDLVEWLGAGVRLLVCLSQDSGPIEGIPVAVGRVHDVLRSLRDLQAQERIFAVGSPSMVGALRDVVREWGIGPELVHTNY